MTDVSFADLVVRMVLSLGIVLAIVLGAYAVIRRRQGLGSRGGGGMGRSSQRPDVGGATAPARAPRHTASCLLAQGAFVGRKSRSAAGGDENMHPDRDEEQHDKRRPHLCWPGRIPPPRH